MSRVAGRQLVTWLLVAEGVSAAAAADSMLHQGRIVVNSQVIRDTKARADPASDDITVDGRPLKIQNWCRYLVVNKPYNVLSCFTDPEGRGTLADYVPVSEVYAAGRLDYDSEGLLLLTDDGWLLHRLTHPRYEHTKTYWVQVEGIPDAAAIARLHSGVTIKGQRTRPADAELLLGEQEPKVPARSVPIRYRAQVPTAWLQVTLREGKKRQVRRMTAAVGHPTLRLLRVAISTLTLGDLAVGAWRNLSDEELDALSRALNHSRQAPLRG